MLRKCYFNPRSREGSDRYNNKKVWDRGNFNPRSREGSDNFFIIFNWIVYNFNPRSREGSDISRTIAGASSSVISIHAPAKGATANWLLHPISGKFQSTLPRRERRFYMIHQRKYWNFNPRSREGSDYNDFEVEKGSLISIHAPAKGATRKIWLLKILDLFQSTLPRRERLVY